MLRTRLWMGAVLIALTVGVLVFDQWFDPWYPFLLLFLLTLGLLACHELLQLLPDARRPFGWLCYGSVGMLILSSWMRPVAIYLGPWTGTPWVVSGNFLLDIWAAIVLLTFIVEMAAFREPGVWLWPRPP